MKKQLDPIPVKVMNGTKAWMYVNQKTVDVYIWQEGVGTLVARITEKQLKKRARYFLKCEKCKYSILGEQTRSKIEKEQARRDGLSYKK